MSKKRKYVGTAIFDIDGVLCDIETEFCERFGYSNRHLYDFNKRYPEHQDLITEFLASPDSYFNAKPIFGGTVLLNQAIHLGWLPVIITSRPEFLGKDTEKWLDFYGIRYDMIWYAVNKYNLISQMVEADKKPVFFVDDAIHHLENLPKGVAGVAWEHPWNVGYYPRAKYDVNSMQVMKKLTQSQNYTPFWS